MGRQTPWLASTLTHMRSTNDLERLSEFNYFRVFFDGSAATESSGAGWVLYGAESVIDDDLLEWTRVVEKSIGLPKGCTVTAAELEACASAVDFFGALLSGSMPAIGLSLKQKARMDFRTIRKLELAELV